MTKNKLSPFQKQLDILKTAKKLNEEGKSKKVLTSLNYNTLKRLKNQIKNPDLEIDRVNNIKLDQNKLLIDKLIADFYYHRGNAFLNLKQYNKAILNFTKAVEKNPNHFAAYNDRGYAYYYLQNYTEAIYNYSKAIDINPSYPDPYNNRGLIYYEEKKYALALDDFNKKLEINPTFASAYFYRGLINYTLGNQSYKENQNGNDNDYKIIKKYYRDSVADFSRAIRINENFFKAYFYRGVVYHKLAIQGKNKNDKEKFIKAIKDYNFVIESQNEQDGRLPTYIKELQAHSLKNLGDIHANTDEIELAIDKYTQAINKKSDYREAYIKRAEMFFIKAEEDFGEEIERALKDYIFLLKMSKNNNDIVNTPLNFCLKNIYTLKINEDVKIKMMKLCAKIMIEIVEKIRKLTFETNCKFVAHYTKLNRANALISEDNKYLRYYNSIYMNDPEEGKIIFDAFKEKKKIFKAFQNGKKKSENTMYIGSFLPVSVKKDGVRHEDELALWRTYGKDDNNNEAMGCSIIIDTEFFDKKPLAFNTSVNLSNYIGLEPSRSVKTSSSDSEDEFIKMDNSISNDENAQSLYNVIYFNRHNKEKRFLGKNGKKINELIGLFEEWVVELIKNKKKLSTNKKNLIDEIVFIMISEICYFFKSSEFSLESELRVIQYVPHDNERIRFDEYALPHKMYINSNKEIKGFLRKIIFGPKVAHPVHWIYFEAKMKQQGYKIVLQKSDCQYQ